MRSLLAIVLFILAASLVIFSQAQAAPPSCGSCGRGNPYEKSCGKLSKQVKYIYEEANEQGAKSEVELCLDLVSGEQVCGVSSDSLLMLSVNTITNLQAQEVCMKFEVSQTNRKIVALQGR
ncbi:hypothetical protein [Bdellovibrio reynosensis]|uniref:Uncharacterized protein n=1 Tax=Bdellovibrio reynosensis TaxID=2835041 RepID=A0ABY4CED0_9BACT|nr:hypothetical protein [Bdellovibrio reynosensis]UOF02819.1 hypothetical protein MNR06_07620 [Bdellovibrio reynosensis]